MKDYKIIDHTADIGIEVSSKEMPKIFLKAAYAMFDIIADIAVSGDSAQVELEVKVEAQNVEELLVAWLAELLSLSDCRGLYFQDFDIKEFSHTNICAKVKGVESKLCKGKTEIKAVTYHGLTIDHKNDCLRAQVIFDV